MEYFSYVSSLFEKLPIDQINAAAELIADCVITQRSMFVVGNGGSASTASHLAQDIGKGIVYPYGIKITSLVDNMSWITAIANDDGYDKVFANQMASCSTDDVLIVISGSGNSPNIINAIHHAKSLGLDVIGLLGFDGGAAMDLCTIPIHIHCYDMGVVEGLHSVICHYLPKKVSEIIENI